MPKLWLNNERVELDPNQAIAITLQVNDVEKPDTFQSSFTNTFTVPLSRVNRRIIKNAQAVGSTLLLRTKVPARLEDDGGQQIVSNGFALINNIDNNNAEITVFSGVVDFFTEIGEFNLLQLDLSSVVIDWTLAEYELNTSNTFTDGFVWAIANYGDDPNSTIDIRNQAPSLFVKYLFNQIASQFSSYSIIDTDGFADSFFESLLIPFTNVSKNRVLFFADIFPIFEQFNIQAINGLTGSVDIDNDWSFPTASDVFNRNTGQALYSELSSATRIFIRSTLDLTARGGQTITVRLDFIGVNTGTSYYAVADNFTRAGTDPNPSLFTRELTATSNPLIIKEPIFIRMSATFNDVVQKVSFMRTDWNAIEASEFGFQFAANDILPDMNAKDFVKTFMQKFGFVADVDNYRKQITFRKFETYANDSNIDYSSNIDTSREILREYQYGDYAKSNSFLYAENSELENPLLGSFNISISNDLLDTTYDVVQSEFQASESYDIDGEARAITLQVLNDSNELEISLSPRVGYINYFTSSGINITDGSTTVNNIDYSTVNFANPEDSQNLTFESLINVYWPTFIDMVRSMEKLTTPLVFDAVEYNNINFFKPVFLNFTYKDTQVIGLYLFQKVDEYQEGQVLKCEFIKL